MSSPGGNARFLPERALPGDARLYIPNDAARERPFQPLTLTPRPERRDRTRIALLGSAVALVVVIVAGLAFWLVRPSPAMSSSPTIDSLTPAPPSADPEDEARLFRLLPPGYLAGSCRPVAPPKDALAQVHCNKNSDTGGAIWASYTLLPDETALEGAFNGIVDASGAVVCPGNMQSPGPWRRNATPDKISGVLICCMQEGRPTVAWTDNDKFVLSTAQSAPGEPTLPQLYEWWSSHS